MNIEPNKIYILKESNSIRSWLIRPLKCEYNTTWQMEYYAGWEGTDNTIVLDEINLNDVLHEFQFIEVDYSLWLEAALEGYWRNES